MREALSQAGFDLVPIYLGYRVCPKEKPAFGRVVSNSTTKGTTYVWPFIDLFLTEFSNDNGQEIVRLKDRTARESWPKAFWKVENLFPLSRGDFGPHIGLQVNVPHLAKEFLDRQYGDDWNEVAYRIWDHRNNTAFNEAQRVRVVTRIPGQVR